MAGQGPEALRPGFKSQLSDSGCGPWAADLKPGLLNLEARKHGGPNFTVMMDALMPGPDVPRPTFRKQERMHG